MRAPLGWLTLLLVVAGGCSERPAELTRQDNVDGICSDGLLAYSYPLQTESGERTADKLLEPAVEAGCVAPVGAWTDPADAVAEGLPKLVHTLREAERRAVLCCP